MFYCYSEICSIEHECECGNKCCSGFFYSPKKWTLEDKTLTQKMKEELVYHHICPECTGWCEA